MPRKMPGGVPSSLPGETRFLRPRKPIDRIETQADVDKAINELDSQLKTSLVKVLEASELPMINTFNIEENK